MTQPPRALSPVLASLALGFLLSGPPANAQSPAPLPTVPGAERAGEGGLTQAHPSTPSVPGMSPLEAYLITWLLPVSGLLVLCAGFYVDRRVRVIDFRRKKREAK
jgi:hypothetical protein